MSEKSCQFVSPNHYSNYVYICPRVTGCSLLCSEEEVIIEVIEIAPSLEPEVEEVAAPLPLEPDIEEVPLPSQMQEEDGEMASGQGVSK